MELGPRRYLFDPDHKLRDYISDPPLVYVDDG